MTLAERLAKTIDLLPGDRRVLVAFDGPDAAGKTTLANAVAQRVSRPVLRVSIDGWHNPREVRLARGAESPEGYYLDSFDVAALAAECLWPFRDGARSVRTHAYDYRTDEVVAREDSVAPNAALLMDGVFLLRPELREFWTLAIYLEVSATASLDRALARDRDAFGGEEAVRRRYTRRYLPGQVHYRDVADPLARADIVIDNSDAGDPVVLRWPGQG